MRSNEHVRFCVHCQHMAEMERQVSGGKELYKCKNCWAIHMNLADLPLQPQRRTADAITTKDGRNSR